MKPLKEGVAISHTKNFSDYVMFSSIGGAAAGSDLLDKSNL